MVPLYTEKLIAEANEFIKRNMAKVNDEFKPVFHLSPTVGWMNDPNGLVFFNGEYHLFYQFTPFDTKPNVMLWGHVTSKDLYTFKNLGVALAPSDIYSSIYSGGAIDDNGTLNLIYTRHFEKGGVKTETVCRATSSDGLTFDYKGCIFDNETLPEGYSRTDFRDPYPIKIGNVFYVILGGKKLETDEGIIVVLRGKTLEKLEYAFTIGPFKELGNMGECPSFARMGDKDLLIASGCKVPQCGNSFKNVNSNVFILGNIDFENGTYSIDRIREIDKGDTFYAAQIISGAAQPLMFGWLEMWDRTYNTSELGHGWVGSFSLPRRLLLKDGEVFQQPLDGLEAYEKARADTCPRLADISLSFDGEGTVEISAGESKIVITACGYISLDTRKANRYNGCVRRTDEEYNGCPVRVILDRSSVEVFVDGGRETISSRIYMSGEYRLTTSGNVKNLYVREIGI